MEVDPNRSRTFSGSENMQTGKIETIALTDLTSSGSKLFNTQTGLHHALKNNEIASSSSSLVSTSKVIKPNVVSTSADIETNSSRATSKDSTRAPSCEDSMSKGTTQQQQQQPIDTTSIKDMMSNEDDDDFDLSSLRHLMDTMRQAADEIRDIARPPSKEKGKESVVRPRKQKRRHRQLKNRRNSAHRLQVQVDMHFISEVGGQTTINPPDLLLPAAMEEGPPDPPPSPSISAPTAHLYVENEELSRTWPRRNGRNVWRQRSLTDNAGKPGAHVLATSTNQEKSFPIFTSPTSKPGTGRKGSTASSTDPMARHHSTTRTKPASFSRRGTGEGSSSGFSAPETKRQHSAPSVSARDNWVLKRATVSHDGLVGHRSSGTTPSSPHAAAAQDSCIMMSARGAGDQPPDLPAFSVSAGVPFRPLPYIFVSQEDSVRQPPQWDVHY